MLITDEWFHLSENNPVVKLSCLPNYEQEPYYILKKTSTTPLYDERFVDYGYNKIQHMRHLTYVGYSFYILTEAYAMDMPHPTSSYKKEYSKQKEAMKQLYHDFLYDRRWKKEWNQTMSYCSDSLLYSFEVVDSKNVS